MSDPSPRSAESHGLWSALRTLLHLRPSGSLRDTIAEVMDEHEGDDPDDPDDLDTNERTMLRNMLDLSAQKAGDIAVPRSDIIALAADVGFLEAAAVFRAAGHSRLPIYQDSLDQVIGMLHIKDLYAVLAERLHGGAAGEWPQPVTLMREVIFVPPSMPVIDLLGNMRRQRIHMAIIVDEYGGTDGLATIEDIVEEIVGDIEDEHDGEVLPQLLPLENGGYEADARLELEELEATLGVPFEDIEREDEVDTLGGLAVMIAGRVPATGELLEHPNGWTLEILESDGRRIERLRLSPPAAEVEPD